MAKREGVRIGVEEVLLSDQLIADVRGALWQRGGTRGGWQGICAETRLCAKTVSNFAHGETRKPQTETVLRIGAAVGWSFGWYDENGRPVKPGSFDELGKAYLKQTAREKERKTAAK